MASSSTASRNRINQPNERISLSTPSQRALFLATRQLGIQKETEELSSLARRPDAFF